MIIGTATTQYDATNMNRLKTHLIKDGKAVCNPQLKALLTQEGSSEDIDCKKCKTIIA